MVVAVRVLSPTANPRAYVASSPPSRTVAESVSRIDTCVSQTRTSLLAAVIRVSANGARPSITATNSKTDEQLLQSRLA